MARRQRPWFEGFWANAGESVKLEDLPSKSYLTISVKNLILLSMLQFTHLMLLLVCAIWALATNAAGLLMTSMVLQAGSVLNVLTPAAKATGVAGYGITPFHLMALVVVAIALWRLIDAPRPAWPRHLKWPISFLVLYVLVALAGAWWLPQLFEGTPVHDLIKRYGIDELSPLAWNFGHAVQMISLLMLLAVLAAVWLLCQTHDERHRLLTGLALGCALVLVIGAYEQFAPHLQWPSVAAYWANNPGYHQRPLAPAGLALNRIGLPFSEPSYASAYMSAMLLGTLAMALLGRRWWWWAPAAFFCAAGLVNTLGSTGLAAAGAALVGLFFWVVLAALRPSAAWSRRWRAAVLCTLLLVASVWGFRAYEGSAVQPHIDTMVQRLIVHKATSENGVREKSNERAVEIVQETRGLGVGMGSHRASSYLASMLANTGVVGCALFVGMLLTLLWRYWKAPALSDAQIFVAAALPTATLAMGLGIPDLNMPMYWGFIILGFVFCPDDDQIRGHTGSPKSPTQEAASQVSAVGQDS